VPRRNRDTTKYRLASEFTMKSVQEYSRRDLEGFYQQLLGHLGSIDFSRDMAINFFNTKTCRSEAAYRVGVLVELGNLIKVT